MTKKSLTTKRVLIRIVIIISSVEFLIMLFLGIIAAEASIYLKAVLDIALLVILSTPVIYIWIINPFVKARDEAIEQLNHLAHTDPLTQLANRRHIFIHLEKFIAGAIRHKFRGAVLLMDLDGFKNVNDVHGHDAGDEVLVEIANRLRSRIRSEDVVGRLSGDEFVILINHLDTDERVAHDIALQTAEQLINVVNKPIDLNGTQLNIGASIGIRLFGFEELETDTAIKEADIALYRAKQAGKGCSVIFEK